MYDEYESALPAPSAALSLLGKENVVFKGQLLCFLYFLLIFFALATLSDPPFRTLIKKNAKKWYFLA